MTSRRWLRLLAWAVLVVHLVGCAASQPAGSPTPALAIIVATPYPAHAAANPVAVLHDRPAGTPGVTLARGTDLVVQSVVTTADGQTWYLVATDAGERGWVVAAALTLVDDPLRPSPTPRPATPTASAARPLATPTPRPLVITGSGQGLFLRAAPGQGAVIRAYPDGARVVPQGETRELDGRRWVKVVAPDGEVGWMAGEYLRPG